jgi:hypothetical protein
MEMSQGITCRAILNKQKWLLSKIENRKIKQFLSGSWYQWEGGRYKEMVMEAKCSGNNMYSCMKMER